VTKPDALPSKEGKGVVGFLPEKKKKRGEGHIQRKKREVSDFRRKGKKGIRRAPYQKSEEEPRLPPTEGREKFVAV